jgi:hypothetical protein
LTVFIDWTAIQFTEAYGTDIAKVNEAMELTQISHLATKTLRN